MHTYIYIHELTRKTNYASFLSSFYMINSYEITSEVYYNVIYAKLPFLLTKYVSIDIRFVKPLSQTSIRKLMKKIFQCVYLLTLARKHMIFEHDRKNY